MFEEKNRTSLEHPDAASAVAEEIWKMPSAVQLVKDEVPASQAMAFVDLITDGGLPG